MKTVGKKMTVYQWYLVVEGSGEFAFDMLRYDAAFPFRERDTSAMVNRRDKRRLIVCRRGLGTDSGESDRWASFGWRVIEATDDQGVAIDVADRGKPGSLVDYEITDKCRCFPGWPLGKEEKRS